MPNLKSIASHAAFVVGAAIVTADPAYAGQPIPGPVLGAGLPALAVIAGGYYLLRKYRAR